MDLNQVARMIEWLDEERRRDKATIAALEERIQQQQETMTQVSRRVNGIESDQASMRTAFLPAGKEVEVADQLRMETQQMLEQSESKRLTAERETERRAALSRDSLVRPIREIGERMDRLERSIEQMSAIRVEQDRLMSAIPARTGSGTFAAKPAAPGRPGQEAGRTRPAAGFPGRAAPR